jgi:hypothetical protein
MLDLVALVKQHKGFDGRREAGSYITRSGTPHFRFRRQILLEIKASVSGD